MSQLRDGVIKRGLSWSYVIRVTDASGVSKPRWVGGFATDAAAKAARDAARVAARRGEFVNRNRITVAQYLTQWLAGHALEVKPKTHEDYRAIIATYVEPRIGRQQLQSVRPTALTSLYQTLLAEGGRGGEPLSSRTVSYVHAVPRKAFNDAVRTDQLIAINPAERAKRPRRATVQGVRDVWDAEQLGAFLDEVATHRLFPFLRLAAFTGARRGELLHLLGRRPPRRGAEHPDSWVCGDGSPASSGGHHQERANSLGVLGRPNGDSPGVSPRPAGERARPRCWIVEELRSHLHDGDRLADVSGRARSVHAPDIEGVQP